jgi:hypothetical protein
MAVHEIIRAEGTLQLELCIWASHTYPTPHEDQIFTVRNIDMCFDTHVQRMWDLQSVQYDTP